MNISADNPYYKRKKKKIRKKVKNKVKNKGKNKKKYRSENHEKTLYKKLREFLNKNMYYIILLTLIYLYIFWNYSINNPKTSSLFILSRFKFFASMTDFFWSIKHFFKLF